MTNPPPEPASAVPPRSPVLVTGMGAVTPLGVGMKAFIDGLGRARSGVRLLDFVHPSMQSSVAAAADDFQPASVMPEVEARKLPRLVPMALAAATEALTRAGWTTPLEGEAGGKVGLILGTGGGGIDFTLDQAQRMATSSRASLWSVTNATHGNLAGELSIRLGLRGPSLCVSTGCASSSDAAGLAMDMLTSDRPGAPAAIVVVGADAHIRWETLAGMEWLGVISTRDFRPCPHEAPTACRPFDASRDGFVLGEGAWAVVLERQDAVNARSRKPIGEVMGYGSTCDAFHRVRPDPSMEETVRALHQALDHAPIQPPSLAAIQYHGTATALNDRHESEAIKLALGDCAKRIPGSSIKGAIGHPQGASGLASLVAMLGCLGHDRPFMPPTLNLTEPDPACDLHYTPCTPHPLDPDDAMRPFLVNCLAFGAKNSVLVARAFRPA